MRALLLLLAFCLSVSAATITNSFKDQRGNPLNTPLKITPLSAPTSNGVYIVNGPATTVNLTNGYASYALQAGDYKIEQSGRAWYISVPDNTNSYNLNSLSTSNFVIYSYTNGLGFPGKVRVTATDTTPNILGAKVVAGTGISLSTNNAAGNSTLTITATGEGGAATNIVWPVAGTNVTMQTNGLAVTVNATADTTALIAKSTLAEDFQFDNGPNYWLTLWDTNNSALYRAADIVYSNQQWNVHSAWVVDGQDVTVTSGTTQRAKLRASDGAIIGNSLIISNASAGSLSFTNSDGSGSLTLTIDAAQSGHTNLTFPSMLGTGGGGGGPAGALTNNETRAVTMLSSLTVSNVNATNNITTPLLSVSSTNDNWFGESQFTNAITVTNASSTNGGTFYGPVSLVSPTTNSPAMDELVTRWWVDSMTNETFRAATNWAGSNITGGTGGAITNNETRPITLLSSLTVSNLVSTNGITAPSITVTGTETNNLYSMTASNAIFTGPVVSTSTTTSAPAPNELVTRYWVTNLVKDATNGIGGGGNITTLTNVTIYGDAQRTNAAYVYAGGQILSNANGSVKFTGGNITNTGDIKLDGSLYGGWQYSNALWLASQINPRQTSVLFSHFENSLASPFTSAANGGTSSAVGNNTSGTNGIWRLSTSTSGTGVGSIYCSTLTMFKASAANNLTNEFRFYLSALPDANEPYQLRLGYMSAAYDPPSTQPPNGIYLSISTNGGGGVLVDLVTRNANTETRTPTGFSVSAATWYVASIESYGGTGRVRLGTSSSALSTTVSSTENIPTGAQVGPAALIGKVAGTTARTCDLDWFYSSVHLVNAP